MSLKSYNVFVEVDIARKFIRAQAWAIKDDGKCFVKRDSIGLDKPLDGAPADGFTNMVLIGFVLTPGPMILYPEIGMLTHTHERPRMPRAELPDKYLHNELVEKLVREVYEDVIRQYWEDSAQEDNTPDL